MAIANILAASVTGASSLADWIARHRDAFAPEVA